MLEAVRHAAQPLHGHPTLAACEQGQGHAETQFAGALADLVGRAPFALLGHAGQQVQGVVDQSPLGARTPNVLEVADHGEDVLRRDHRQGHLHGAQEVVHIFRGRQTAGQEVLDDGRGAGHGPELVEQVRQPPEIGPVGQLAQARGQIAGDIDVGQQGLGVLVVRRRLKATPQGLGGFIQHADADVGPRQVAPIAGFMARFGPARPQQDARGFEPAGEDQGEGQPGDELGLRRGVAHIGEAQQGELPPVPVAPALAHRFEEAGRIGPVGLVVAIGRGRVGGPQGPLEHLELRAVFLHRR